MVRVTSQPWGVEAKIESSHIGKCGLSEDRNGSYPSFTMEGHCLVRKSLVVNEIIYKDTNPS